MAAAPARARAAVGSRRSSASTKLSQDAPQAAGASGNPHGGRTRRAATAPSPAPGMDPCPTEGPDPKFSHLAPTPAMQNHPQPSVGARLPAPSPSWVPLDPFCRGAAAFSPHPAAGQGAAGVAPAMGGPGGWRRASGDRSCPDTGGFQSSGGRAVPCRKPDSQLSWQRASPGLLSK